jgi:hypothetical protein
MDLSNLKTTDVKELQAYIDERWELADDDEKCALFDLADGLYWYCHDYHTGQWSDEYSVLSTLDYSPSPLARGVEEGSTAQEVYSQLVEANQTK